MKKGDRVETSAGSGVVAYVRMSPDDAKVAAVSVVLDTKRDRSGYTGSLFPADKVELAVFVGEMRRSWMSVGREYWDHNEARRTEDDNPVSKSMLVRAIDEMEWEELSPDREYPMGPGLSIEEVIKELRIPRVTRISYSTRELAPYGFYGIEGHFKNGRVRLYVVDSGTHCTPVCSDHWLDNGEALAAVKEASHLVDA